MSPLFSIYGKSFFFSVSNNYLTRALIVAGSHTLWHSTHINASPLPIGRWALGVHEYRRGLNAPSLDEFVSALPLCYTAPYPLPSLECLASYK